MNTNYLEEVERALRATVIDDPDYKAFREKTTGLVVLGHRLPLMREIERKGFSFYDRSTKDILTAWDTIWRTTDIHEAMYLPLFYYRRHKGDLNPSIWKVMKGWVDRIENWEHADALCLLYSIMYEKYPKLVEPTLFKWNRSKAPWKRRASIVSTIYYASKNRTPPPLKTVLKLIKPLISDTDDYIRKGVGWQLREAYKLWPEETLAFIEQHLTDLSAITFSYATEKIPAKKKARLKAVRKSYRQTVKQTH